ncbi:MAG: hypothetical protein FWG70_10770 [Oscillospiraceae bacterium]|nr:hypothetical protein [Oscillospiraceae bacterium]
MVKQSTLHITISGLLIAFGIVIPMFSPFRIMLEPAASYTLASHVPVFIAMFISPFSAIAVAAGTTIGFALGPYTPVVVFRAASHVVFAALGALYWQSICRAGLSAAKVRVFSLAVALTHAVSELIVVSIFYFLIGMGDEFYQKGFLFSVVLLVGLGTIIHSMIDFEIAYAVKKIKGFDYLTMANKKIKHED